MATLTIELTNTIPTGKTYNVYIKKGNTVGDLVTDFESCGIFNNTTGSFTISPTLPLEYGEQYWIKIVSPDGSYIIENIYLNNEQYFLDRCTP